MIFSATELDTVPHLYQSAIGCRNARVLPDINEIRRKNAERLLASNFNGNRVAMADALETQPSFLGRLLNANAAQRRNIGDSLARRIEQLCRREPNWLDHDHDRAPAEPEAAGGEGRPAGDVSAKLMARFNASPPDVQALIRLALDDPDLPIDDRATPSLKVMLDMVRTQIRLHIGP